MLEVSHNISQLLWVHILPIQSFLHGKGLFSHLLPFVAFITFHGENFINGNGLQCILLGAG